MLGTIEIPPIRAGFGQLLEWALRDYGFVEQEEGGQDSAGRSEACSYSTRRPASNGSPTRDHRHAREGIVGRHGWPSGISPSEERESMPVLVSSPSCSLADRGGDQPANPRC
jgi:hypothetical protein